jgi:hypothetical protein
MNWFDKQIHRFVDWFADDASPVNIKPNTCYVYAVEKCCCGEKRILLGDINTIGYHSQRRIALMDNGWESDSGRKLCTTCLTDRTITRVYEEDE